MTLSSLITDMDEGHAGCFSALLEAGANLNVKDTTADTPLLLALLHKDVEHVVVLLSKPDIDVFASDSVHATPLRLASHLNKEDQPIVLELLKAKGMWPALLNLTFFD